MAIHYNAFISYKHEVADSRVADAIQRGLENYHIPMKIKKSTGIKRINRIFRDKNELPITADLNETISEALNNSDFLIVICSTKTKESIWVSREIQYFLQTHTKKQILTVLVDGEPVDVIPPVLLFEEKTIYNNMGFPETVKIPVEPLSCDFRLPKRLAKHQELPRLAAALIGCSYDELMNRHRQHRMRQATLAFSGVLAVSLLFGGYMYKSRQAVQKNLNESLRNQSRYLANESEDLLNNEQRITALQLALESLPKDEDDKRPITPESIRALTRATMAYTANAGTTISAYWNYSMQNAIKAFAVTSKDSYMGAIDEGGNVNIWDLNLQQLIMKKTSPTHTFDGIFCLDEETFIYYSNKEVKAYNAKKNEEVWSFTTDDKDSIRQVIITPKNNVAVQSANTGVFLLDSTNGKTINTFVPPESSEDGMMLSIVDYCFSEDESRMAFTVIQDIYSYSLGTIDKNGKANMSEPYDSRIRDLYWSGDNLFIALPDSSSFGSSTFGNYRRLSTDKTVIKCVDTKNFEEKWSYDFYSSETVVNSGFLHLSTDNIAYFAGNIAVALSEKDGKEIYTNNVNDSIINISDNNDDGLPTYVTAGGHMGLPASDDPMGVFLGRFFTDNLVDSVIHSSNMFILQKGSNEILCYGMHSSDDQWNPLNNSLTLKQPPKYFYLDDTTLSTMVFMEDNVEITIMDMSSSHNYYQINLSEIIPDLDFADCSYLGKWDDKLCIYVYDYSKAYLVQIDPATRESTVEELGEGFFSTYTPKISSDGKIITSAKNESYSYDIISYDISSKETKKYALPEDYDAAIAPNPVISPDNNYAYFGKCKNNIMDLKSGTVTSFELPDKWEETKCTAFSEDSSKMAYSNGESILILDKEGKQLTEISSPGVSPVAMSFFNSPEEGEILLVAFDNDSLYRYSVKDGQFLGKSSLTINHHSTNTPTASFTYDAENNLMYYQQDDILDIIDASSWIELTCIDNCFGHQKKDDIFVVMSYTNSEEYYLGYFNHYSTEELIEKGKEILKGSELTPEQKSQYGIMDD